MADNFRISVTSKNQDHLKAAIQMALDKHKSVVGWAVHPEKGFILYWTTTPGVHQFPVPLKRAETLVEFINEWLQQQNYGPEPDHDGSNSKGFTVYNENWGYVNGQSAAFLAIKPEWLVYGK